MESEILEFCNEIINKTILEDNFKIKMFHLIEKNYFIDEFIKALDLEKQYCELLKENEKIKIRLVKDNVEENNKAIFNLVIPPASRFFYNSMKSESNKQYKIKTNDYNFLWNSDSITENILKKIISKALNDTNYKKDLKIDTKQKIQDVIDELKLSLIIPEEINFKIYEDDELTYTIIIRIINDKTLRIGHKEW